jgi:hypothetical protein
MKFVNRHLSKFIIVCGLSLVAVIATLAMAGTARADMLLSSTQCNSISR